MKTILLPFLDDDTAESALQSAQVIAKRHGSYIEAVYVLTHEPYIAAGGLAFSGGFYPVPSPGDRNRVDTAYARFTHQLTEHGLPLCNVQDAPEGASASWRETAGIESYLVGEIGRLFDLVVVGRTSSRSAVDWSAIFEGALFDSGKPVLVAPESAPETIGDNIVVYWNCSTENARTISLGMPFLVRAEKVTVVTVTGALEPGPDGAELVKYLKRLRSRGHCRFSGSERLRGGGSSRP